MKYLRWAAAGAALIVATGLMSAEAAPKPAKIAVYQPPKALPFELTVDTVNLRELVSSPVTKAMLADIDPILANAGLAGPFGNYTFPQMRRILPKAVTPENIAKLNAELAKLPRDQWPVK